MFVIVLDSGGSSIFSTLAFCKQNSLSRFFDVLLFTSLSNNFLMFVESI